MNHKISKGETLFMEGEPGDCAYILEKGRIALSILVNGQSVQISELHEGTLFGEMVLIDSQLRSATAVAVEDCEVTDVPQKYFQEKLESSDPFIALLLKVLLQRYREMRARLDSLTLDAIESVSLFIDERVHGQQHGDVMQAARQLEAENALQQAFTAGHLELFYQPIVALADNNRVCGCESLIRWRHPERGLVPPSDFIGLAEESGLIVPIGQWIVEEAVAACQRICKHVADFDFVSINLSGKQFAGGDLIGNIQRIFAREQVSAEHIKFEITESILMANPVEAAASLNALKQLGCSIALDDFGTGYSSFSYLHRFPINTLKIDKSFISTMRDNAKSYEIVKSLAILAKSIGMSIVAEGIETQEEHQLLVELGVDYGQGYLYARPMPEAAFFEFLAGRS